MSGAEKQRTEKLGSRLTKSRFVILVRRMFGIHINETLFECGDDDLLWYNMASMKTVLWNVCYASTDLCDQIVEFNLQADIVSGI